MANILLADDEVIFLRSTGEFLEDHGHSVTVANNSEVAFSELEQGDFDLVLLDHKMPGNKDFELVRELKQLIPEVPVIIITGFPSLSMIGDLFELDVYDYISKPINYQLLRKRVESAVKQRRLQQALALSHENLECRIMKRTEELGKANNQLLAEAVERAHLERLVLDTLERENTRIGKDLHDVIGQILTAATFKISALKACLEANSAQTTSLVKDITELVSGAIGKVRTLSFTLCPMIVEDEGLELALEDLADSSSKMFGVECSLVCPMPVGECRPGAATSLFRIAQEAITNAVKHGQASQVFIEITREASMVKLLIVDDGIGFQEKTARKGGQGLKVMRYRANTIGAELRFENNDKGGTTVVCSLKLVDFLKR